MNANWDGFRRKRLCEQTEPQQLPESERLRDIRTASSMGDLYRLLGMCRPSETQIDGPHPHVKELNESSFNKTRTNPISVVCCAKKRVLTSVPNSNIADDASNQLASADGQMRQTNRSKPQRRRRTASKPPRRLDKPHSKMPFVALDDSSQRPHSFCTNNRIVGVAEAPLKSVEHELDEVASGDNYYDNVENLEWYIRLASRCYRDGFQWHADYLRGKSTQLETKQPLTRRPLQLIIEQHLKQQERKVVEESSLMAVQWSPSSPQVARRDNANARVLQQAARPRSPPENKRNFEIRIELNPTGDKYRSLQQVPQTHKPSSSSSSSTNGVIRDKSITFSSSSDYRKSQSSTTDSLSTTQPEHLIDDFDALNISSPTTPLICGDPIVVMQHKLPQIVLTDCCSINYVCHEDDDDDDNDKPTSTSRVSSVRTNIHRD